MIVEVYLNPSQMDFINCFEGSVRWVLSNLSTGEITMATGTVKWFNEKKGFGFIVPDDGGKDLFVHHTNITTEGYRTLQDGQKVEYEAAEGQKGPEATQVRGL